MKKVWDKLQSEFPTWEIHHTGGGIFVIRKDFQDNKGNNIMVSISEDVVLLMQSANDESKYISHSEFLDNEDVYWNNSFHLEVIIMKLEDNQVKITNNAKVFDPDVLEEIKSHFLKLGNIIWN